MNTPITFFLQGSPAPGGSKTVMFFWHKGTGKLITKRGPSGREMPVFNVTDDAGVRNKTWKRDVGFQARSFMRGARPFTCPIKVELVHFLQRPQGHYGTGRNSQILKPSAPRYHTVKPDALKLARATEDALTGIIWPDDAGNVRICAEKRYCAPGEKSGCAVRIVLLEGQVEPPEPADEELPMPMR